MSYFNPRTSSLETRPETSNAPMNSSQGRPAFLPIYPTLQLPDFHQRPQFPLYNYNYLNGAPPSLHLPIRPLAMVPDHLAAQSYPIQPVLFALPGSHATRMPCVMLAPTAGPSVWSQPQITEREPLDLSQRVARIRKAKDDETTRKRPRYNTETQSLSRETVRSPCKETTSRDSPQQASEAASSHSSAASSRGSEIACTITQKSAITAANEKSSTLNPRQSSLAPFGSYSPMDSTLAHKSPVEPGSLIGKQLGQMQGFEPANLAPGANFAHKNFIPPGITHPFSSISSGTPGKSIFRFPSAFETSDSRTSTQFPSSSFTNAVPAATFPSAIQTPDSRIKFPLAFQVSDSRTTAQLTSPNLFMPTALPTVRASPDSQTAESRITIQMISSQGCRVIPTPTVSASSHNHDSSLAVPSNTVQSASLHRISQPPILSSAIMNTRHHATRDQQPYSSPRASVRTITDDVRNTTAVGNPSETPDFFSLNVVKASDLSDLPLSCSPSQQIQPPLPNSLHPKVQSTTFVADSVHDPGHAASTQTCTFATSDHNSISAVQNHGHTIHSHQGAKNKLRDASLPHVSPQQMSHKKDRHTKQLYIPQPQALLIPTGNTHGISGEPGLDFSQGHLETPGCSHEEQMKTDEQTLMAADYHKERPSQTTSYLQMISHANSKFLSVRSNPQSITDFLGAISENISRDLGPNKEKSSYPELDQNVQKSVLGRIFPHENTSEQNYAEYSSNRKPPTEKQNIYLRQSPDPSRGMQNRPTGVLNTEDSKDNNYEHEQKSPALAGDLNLYQIEYSRKGTSEHPEPDFNTATSLGLTQKLPTTTTDCSQTGQPRDTIDISRNDLQIIDSTIFQPELVGSYKDAARGKGISLATKTQSETNQLTPSVPTPDTSKLDGPTEFGGTCIISCNSRKANTSWKETPKKEVTLSCVGKGFVSETTREDSITNRALAQPKDRPYHFRAGGPEASRASQVHTNHALISETGSDCRDRVVQGLTDSLHVARTPEIKVVPDDNALLLENKMTPVYEADIECGSQSLTEPRNPQERLHTSRTPKERTNFTQGIEGNVSLVATKENDLSVSDPASADLRFQDNSATILAPQDIALTTGDSTSQSSHYESNVPSSLSELQVGNGAIQIHVSSNLEVPFTVYATESNPGINPTHPKSDKESSEQDLSDQTERSNELRELKQEMTSKTSITQEPQDTVSQNVVMDLNVSSQSDNVPRTQEFYAQRLKLDTTVHIDDKNSENYKNLSHCFNDKTPRLTHNLLEDSESPAGKQTEVVATVPSYIDTKAPENYFNGQDVPDQVLSQEQYSNRDQIAMGNTDSLALTSSCTSSRFSSGSLDSDDESSKLVIDLEAVSVETDDLCEIASSPSQDQHRTADMSNTFNNNRYNVQETISRMRPSKSTMIDEIVVSDKEVGGDRELELTTLQRTTPDRDHGLIMLNVQDSPFQTIVVGNTSHFPEDADDASRLYLIKDPAEANRHKRNGSTTLLLDNEQKGTAWPNAIHENLLVNNTETVKSVSKKFESQSMNTKYFTTASVETVKSVSKKFESQSMNTKYFTTASVETVKLIELTDPVPSEMNTECSTEDNLAQPLEHPNKHFPPVHVETDSKWSSVATVEPGKSISKIHPSLWQGGLPLTVHGQNAKPLANQYHKRGFKSEEETKNFLVDAIYSDILDVLSSKRAEKNASTSLSDQSYITCPVTPGKQIMYNKKSHIVTPEFEMRKLDYGSLRYGFRPVYNRKKKRWKKHYRAVKPSKNGSDRKAHNDKNISRSNTPAMHSNMTAVSLDHTSNSNTDTNIGNLMHVSNSFNTSSLQSVPRASSEKAASSDKLVFGFVKDKRTEEEPFPDNRFLMCVTEKENEQESSCNSRCQAAETQTKTEREQPHPITGSGPTNKGTSTATELLDRRNQIGESTQDMHESDAAKGSRANIRSTVSSIYVPGLSKCLESRPSEMIMCLPENYPSSSMMSRSDSAEGPHSGTHSSSPTRSASIREVLFSSPQEIKVYPIVEGSNTTVGDDKVESHWRTKLRMHFRQNVFLQNQLADDIHTRQQANIHYGDQTSDNCPGNHRNNQRRDSTLTTLQLQEDQEKLINVQSRNASTLPINNEDLATREHKDCFDGSRHDDQNTVKRTDSQCENMKHEKKMKGSELEKDGRWSKTGLNTSSATEDDLAMCIESDPEKEVAISTDENRFAYGASSKAFKTRRQQITEYSMSESKYCSQFQENGKNHVDVEATGLVIYESIDRPLMSELDVHRPNAALENDRSKFFGEQPEQLKHQEHEVILADIESESDSDEPRLVIDGVTDLSDSVTLDSAVIFSSTKLSWSNEAFSESEDNNSILQGDEAVDSGNIHQTRAGFAVQYICDNEGILTDPPTAAETGNRTQLIQQEEIVIDVENEDYGHSEDMVVHAQSSSRIVGLSAINGIEDENQKASCDRNGEKAIDSMIMSNEVEETADKNRQGNLQAFGFTDEVESISDGSDENTGQSYDVITLSEEDALSPERKDWHFISADNVPYEYYSEHSFTVDTDLVQHEEVTPGNFQAVENSIQCNQNVPPCSKYEYSALPRLYTADEEFDPIIMDEYYVKEVSKCPSSEGVVRTEMPKLLWCTNNPHIDFDTGAGNVTIS